jgi:hypothetical protein
VRRLGAVTGLAYEAQCLRRAFGSTPIAIQMTGGRAQKVPGAVAGLLEGGATALLSFGLAAGLDPALAPGRVMIAEAVALPDGRRVPADQAWLAALRRAAGPEEAFGIIAGVDAPVTAVADKRSIQRSTGALAIDMESHAVALALEGRAALAVVRVIVDPAHRVVPPAAVAALRNDGGIDLPALLRSLLRRPGQVPGIIMLTRDAVAARAGLHRAAALVSRSLEKPAPAGRG